MYYYYDDSSEENLFRLYPATMILIAINAVLFLAFNIVLEGRGIDALHLGTVSLSDVTEHGEIYRLITSMFLHADAEHLLNNMFVLFVVGGLYEENEGKKRFLFSYLLGGLVAGLTSIGYDWVMGTNISSLGASGAIFAIEGAMIAAVLKDRSKLGHISPLRLIAFAGLGIYAGLRDAHTDNAAHIGGFIAGLLIGFVVSKSRTFYQRYN